MVGRIIGHRLRLSLAVCAAILSVSLARAAGDRGEGEAHGGVSFHGEITPFGIVQMETARVCVSGLPSRRVTRALRWEIRFIAANGEVVATEQLEVPHQGFECADLSYEEALTRTAASPALEPTGRVQLAVQAVPLVSGQRGLALLVQGGGEVSNVGTLEIIAASGQTMISGRFGLKTLDVSDPTRP